MAALFAVVLAVRLMAFKGGLPITTEASLLRRMLLPLGLFVVWSAISITYAASAGWVIHETLTWGLYLTFLSLFWLLLQEGSGLTTVYKGFLITACILGLNSIIDVLSITNFADSEGTIRIRYGKFAELLATILPLIAAIALYAKRKQVIVISAGWLLGWSALMLSLSKGAFLAGSLAHIVFFAGSSLFARPGFRGRALKLAGVWLVFTVIFQASFSIWSQVPSTTDYITGAAEKTRGTSIFRTFAWRVGLEMISQHPVVGVGAGNFGIAFNDARAARAERNPKDRTPEIAEDYIVERAHNEPLQILAELGIIGGLLSGLGLCIFLSAVIRKFLQSRFQLSPVLWSALAGMLGFGISSMVSSFSFRAIQNGIAFFLIATIAVYQIDRRRPGRATERAGRFRIAVAFGGLAFGLLMTAFTGSKALGEYYASKAEAEGDSIAASEIYRSSIAVDRDNASVYYYLSARQADAGRHNEAAASLREGIDRGLGVSITYSLLAEYQLLAGDADESERTLREAIHIFPNSVFLRVRLGIFLMDVRHDPASAAEFEYASSIDPRQAKGWQMIMTDGSVAAYYAAKTDETIAPPVDLWPANAALHYLDK